MWYNSCKHRSCPQCQGLASEQWLQNTQALLLNCPHHHVIFTLPSELHGLWRYNRLKFSNLFFKVVQQTLETFAKDPKYLGAKPGVLVALHTWGRRLNLHPHLHVLISHGGLNTGGDWVHPRKKHLYPQRPVMMVFRGKLISALRQALAQQDWALEPGLTQRDYGHCLNQLCSTQWVVHFCQRYDHPRGVAKYLARYVKRSPFKNTQLLALSTSHVRFAYQSHRTHKREIETLSGPQFIHRIMEHIPLRRRSSVRYYGLYTSAVRAQLDVAKQHNQQAPTCKPERLSWAEYLEQRGTRPVCRQCGLPLHHEEEVARIDRAA